MNKKWPALAGSLAVFALTACAGLRQTPTVKVVASVPLGADGWGESIVNDLQLALDEANGKAGEVNVELVVINTSEPEGDPFSPHLEREAAAQAVADTSVVAYIGPATGQQAVQSMPLLNQASMAQVSAASWPGLTKPGFGPGEPGIYYPTGTRHFFRVGPSDDLQGTAAASWTSQLNIRTVYLVDDGSAYGQSLASSFHMTASQLGIQIVAHETLAAGSTPEVNGALAQRIVESQADLLYYGGSVDSASADLIGAVRTLRPGFTIMGAEAMVQPALVNALGPALADGIYATNSDIPVERLDSAAAADYLEHYRTAYDAEPNGNTADFYEAMKVVLAAIESAEQPTRQGVLDAMQHLGEFPGIRGAWQFSDTGDTALTRMSGMQIQNGAWAFVDLIE